MTANSHGGHRPGAGRPKGARNKSTVARAKLLNLFQRMDYNPVEELINEAKDYRTSPKVRVAIHRQMLRLLNTGRMPARLLTTLLSKTEPPDTAPATPLAPVPVPDGGPKLDDAAVPF